MLVNPNLGIDPQIRSVAGVKLKNGILNNFSMIDADTISFIKSQIVQGLSDSQSLVRNVTGTVITNLFSKVTINGWPEILPELLNLIESAPETVTKESAMSAFSKICEDSAKILDQEYNGSRPLEYIIPRLLSFTNSPSEKIRSLSVFCINQFVTTKSVSFIPHIDAFLNAIFTLTADTFADTKINICNALVQIMYTRADKLEPHLEGVLNYIIHCMGDDNEQVATEACEFILQLAEAGKEVFEDEVVQRFLPLIIPTILSTMTYSENDRALIKALNEEDQDVDDQINDIRPQFAKSKEHASASKDKSTTANGDMGDEDEDDDYDDDDDDDFDSLSEWNLRKGSAATLDVLASRFPSDVITLALPYLRTNSLSSEWYIKEAAILAFGAISQGCIDYISPNLPELIPFLIEQLKNPEPSVRQITCWTLSRYSTWISFQSYEYGPREYLEPTLRGLLDCCLDKNKKVQAAACSACSIFTEETSEQLIPYLEPILTQYAKALKIYKTKNRWSLYDSIQTLFEKLGPDVASPKLAQIIVPVLHARWDATSNEDKDLWQLMECLSAVTSVLGMYMTQYAPNMYSRCVKILSDIIFMEQNQDMDPSVEIPDKEFEITAIDLIDGLVQGLKHNIVELATQVQPPLIELLLFCFEDEVFEVRQSALATLGDLAINAIDLLVPSMDKIMKHLITQMDMAFTPAVCNNAVWSAGEIVLKLGKNVEPYAKDLFTRIWQLLDSDDSVSTVLENAAIAIGRMGQACPDLLGPHVGTVIDKWVYYIKDLEENEEKDSAFIGMCQIVCANPSGLSNEKSLSDFITIIVTYDMPSETLRNTINQVLQGYKGLVPNWDEFVSKLPNAAQERIRYQYSS